jgi:predicted membrane channel-forming protein YqfA (hemolysin III family)
MKKYLLLKKLALTLPITMALLSLWVVIISYVERGEVRFDLVVIGGAFLSLGVIQYLLSTIKDGNPTSVWLCPISLFDWKEKALQ